MCNYDEGIPQECVPYESIHKRVFQRGRRTVQKIIPQGVFPQSRIP